MNNNEIMDHIDMVIPWVDGADPVWRTEKELYEGKVGDDRPVRYRDWDNLRYLFRGIEKNMPWIRKVHFVTWGHIPAWINRDCSKLNIVKHEDYIPKKYLPTFSSHPIELNLHRIKGLSEHFIYSNDDIYFLKPIQPTCYFKNGLPVDSAIQSVLKFERWDGIDHIVVNNLILLNRNFNKREVIKTMPKNWFSYKYGKRTLQNLFLSPIKNFTGFSDYHMPNAYLKSTFEEVWKKENKILDDTCNNRIRCSQDVNQWLMRYWQLASGKFIPSSPPKGKLFVIGQDDEEIKNIIVNKKCDIICLSDDSVEIDFDKEKNFINELFETIYPNKSSFEC